MAQCNQCHAELQSAAAFCPQCGHSVNAVPGHSASPPPPPNARSVAQAPGPDLKAVQEQAATAARETWNRIQLAGPARVGIGLMGGSAVFLLWSSQRGIWGTNPFGLLFMVAMLAYLGMREWGVRDLFPDRWWAPYLAVSYLALKGLSGFELELGSLLFLAGAGLLAYAYLWPLKDWVRSAGWDWRYGLHGYRRPVAVGALLAALSLLLNWVPASSSAGWWSGGYTYRYNSYYQSSGYEWDSFKWYNPGSYYPSVQGLAADGSVLLMYLIIAAFAYATLVPRFPVPRWYRFLPFMAGAWGLLMMLAMGSFYWGGALFLVGSGLMAWGGYNLSLKGLTEGKGDLRELPLERWLARWL